jgi:hypothetical protein
MLFTIMVVALCATQAVVARTHHRGPKTATAALATKPGKPGTAMLSGCATDEIALDRKIKGICRGC